MVLFAAACYATAHVTTKRLTRTDGPLPVLFWMCAIQLPMGLIGAIPGWTWPAAGDLVPLTAVGVFSLAAHYCFTRALSLADATVVIPIDFLRLPLIAVVGFVLYAEPFDPFVLGGGGLILAGTYASLRYEGRGRANAAGLGPPAARRARSRRGPRGPLP